MHLITLTEAQYEEAESELAGLCTTCKRVVNHGTTDPDAEGDECEDCGEPTVQGLLNAMVEGNIGIGGVGDGE